MCEQMEGYSIAEEMSGTDEQIELALLWVRMIIVGRVWGRGSLMGAGENEVGNSFVG